MTVELLVVVVGPECGLGPGAINHVKLVDVFCCRPEIPDERVFELLSSRTPIAKNQNF